MIDVGFCWLCYGFNNYFGILFARHEFFTANVWNPEKPICTTSLWRKCLKFQIQLPRRTWQRKVNLIHYTISDFLSLYIIFISYHLVGYREMGGPDFRAWGLNSDFVIKVGKIPWYRGTGKFGGGFKKFWSSKKGTKKVSNPKERGQKKFEQCWTGINYQHFSGAI